MSVGTSRSETDDESSAPCRTVRLCYPLLDLASVRRIHPATLGAQCCFRPSSTVVKYRAHFAFFDEAQTSSVNKNPPLSFSKSDWGVDQSSVALLK
jgi:hypothetical protein